MKNFISIPQSVLLLGLLFQNSGLFSQPNFSKEELTQLKIISGINYTFKNFANEIWPGYDLSKESYIAYLPDKWALYINTQNTVEDFERYPPEWPDLGTQALIHKGTYKDLVGQFEFDFQIDSISTFAMGLPGNLVFSFDNPSYMLFSTTIHEGFHQYQRKHFGEIPWAREENYPILDKENTALASLEMQILKDALVEIHAGNANELVELIKQFVAVRLFRWEHSDNFVKKYEQGQEINEGTARYVEMKAVDCFLNLNCEQIGNLLLTDLAKDMAGISMPELLIDDMEARLTGISVSPEDMPRYRIYPVGATLGYIMDELNINWKEKFQTAGYDVSFAKLLNEYFDMDVDHLGVYLDKAKVKYRYQEILTQGSDLIDKYFSSYKKAKDEFEGQQGIKVEIDLPNNGILRFRSTKSRKWIVENGKIILCLNYNLYSLKSMINNNMVLEIHNKALSDENDWEQKRKKVVFFIRNFSELIINDSPLSLTKDIEKSFDKIELAGENFKFEAESKGKINIYNNIIKIDLR